MTTARRLRLAVLIAALTGIALVVFVARNLDRGERTGGAVTLLSALPLARGEGDVADVLAGRSAPDPLYRWLERRRGIAPIDAVGAGALGRAPVLLAIQPRALAPEELVAIDDWVREGGRAVMFVDPLLGWPSRYPIGDARRAPLSDMLGPIETHWGLTMTPGADGVRRLPGGGRVTVSGAGTWASDGRCRVTLGGLIADCAIGRGRALLVADADLLHAALWEKPFLWRGSEAPQLLLALIEAAERGAPPAAVPATRRVAIPLAVIGAALLFALVIPLLLFLRLRTGLRARNAAGTSGGAARPDPSEGQKVGQNPS
ncbi:hypothetical protein D1610_06055 [Sphingomonas gilva]|uniref:Uncharacterized protein n=1 Tax=Sphingomonas gilva TaxID=2305907 RepID=A0A396RQ69_9SPHN|nr:hypothetical protein [Sphingomonas gilva]RHW18056.1 hypothetical protein D1610_06055 [Sphingomonas gilva]